MNEEDGLILKKLLEKSDRCLREYLDYRANPNRDPKHLAELKDAFDKVAKALDSWTKPNRKCQLAY